MLTNFQVRNAFGSLRAAAAEKREPTTAELVEAIDHGIAILASVVDSLTKIANAQQLLAAATIKE